MSLKIMPLQTVLIKGELYVQAKSFDVLSNEIKFEDEDYRELFMRILVTDINKNPINKFQMLENVCGEDAKEEDVLNFFKEHLDELKYKVYVSIPVVMKPRLMKGYSDAWLKEKIEAAKKETNYDDYMNVWPMPGGGVG